MAATKLTQSLASLSEDISKDLDRLADRAFELAKQAKSLQEHSHKRYADKGVQAAVGSSSQPAYKLDRSKRLDAFQFQPLNKKMNWKKLRGLNLDQMPAHSQWVWSFNITHSKACETDTASLMDVYNNIAYADLSTEGVYELCESNLLKVIHTCQLLLQFQQHNVEQAYHAQQLADEQCNELAAAMQRLPELSMTDVKEGLLQLEGEFYGVADADLDAMFTQARVEERTAASNMIESSVQQAKAALTAQNHEHQEIRSPVQAPLAHPPQQQQYYPQQQQQYHPQQQQQFDLQQQQQFHPQQQQQQGNDPHSAALPSYAYSSTSSSVNLPPPAFSVATSQGPERQQPQSYPPLYQQTTRDSNLHQGTLVQGSSGGTHQDTSTRQTSANAVAAASAAEAAAGGQHPPEAGPLRHQASSVTQLTGGPASTSGSSGNASLSRFRT